MIAGINRLPIDYQRQRRPTGRSFKDTAKNMQVDPQIIRVIEAPPLNVTDGGIIRRNLCRLTDNQTTFPAGEMPALAIGRRSPNSLHNKWDSATSYPPHNPNINLCT